MRIHGVCSYNGANYSGWQKQINETSVQKEIEKVLSTIFNTEINIQGSGRTDALVHANNQHFHFEVNDDKKVDLDRLLYSVNSMLPEDIKIKSFEVVDQEWHARFSAKAKRYIYRVKTIAKDPFNTNLMWLNPHPFDYDLLVKSLKLFEGKHNFRDFTSKEEDDDNFVREISSIEVNKLGDDVSISFVGNGFMRYQIRFMVGTAFAVATKDIDISYITKHLDSDKPREITHYKAPGQGLYLDEVYY